MPLELDIPTTSIIKGDLKSVTISAASVSEEEKGPGLQPGRRDPSPLGHHPPLPNGGLIHACRHLHSELL